MSDCILCGGDSGGSEYAICGECCEANAASERRVGKQCADCYMYCDCDAVYYGESCECCGGRMEEGEKRYFQRAGEAGEWRISEKRSGAFAFAYGIVALLSFAAGVACGWLLL